MESKISRRELQDMVDEAAKTGEMSEQTSELASRALQFEELDGRRRHGGAQRIVALARNADKRDDPAVPSGGAASRIPVHDGRWTASSGTSRRRTCCRWPGRTSCSCWPTCCGPSASSSRATPASQLLEFMQREPQRLAVLVDEHGATAGLVTFEDLVEELVGEVMSEHDRGAPPIVREPDGTLMARGEVALREVERELESCWRRRPASTRWPACAAPWRAASSPSGAPAWRRAAAWSSRFSTPPPGSSAAPACFPPLTPPSFSSPRRES